jgi:bacterial leucyl aminopeptidase
MWSFCVHTTGASALLFVTILEDRVSRSFRIIFLSSFALLFIFVAVFLTAGDSVDANPPSYWITIDESEFEHVAAAGLKQGFEIVERRGGLAIVKLDENQIFELTGKMHEHFHKCAGFIRHDSYDDASRSIDKSFAADLNAVFVDYTINNDANVNPMLAEAQEPFIRQTIIDLSSLHTRRHDQEGGLDGANMILNKWRALALGRTDISVTPYAHLNAQGAFITQQPSIVMTVQGTEFPDEIVVVGGHQDSIVSSGADRHTLPALMMTHPGSHR